MCLVMIREVVCISRLINCKTLTTAIIFVILGNEYQDYSLIIIRACLYLPCLLFHSVLNAVEWQVTQNTIFLLHFKWQVKEMSTCLTIEQK